MHLKMKVSPGEVLKQAREAHSQKEYALSLEKYKWFYENALDIDESFYGVRLSYCLDEWAELAKEYPLAKEELVKLKDVSLENFKSNQSHQAFHEYSSISEYLNCFDEVLQTFQLIQEQDEELASKVFSLVYQSFAEKKNWDVCRKYLGNGYKKYTVTLDIFDHMIKFAQESSGEEKVEIISDAELTFEREVLWLLEMLDYIDAPSEFDSAINKIGIDLKQRKKTKLYKRIMRKAPNKKRNEMDGSTEPPIR